MHTAEFKAKVGLEAVSQFTHIKESQQFFESCSCVAFRPGVRAPMQSIPESRLLTPGSVYDAVAPGTRKMLC